MQKSKLILYLKCFLKSEMQELKDYLYSDLIKKEKEKDKIRQLFSILKSLYPDFSKLDKDYLISSIYKNDERGEKKLNRLNGRLLKIIKQFIRHKESIEKNFGLEELSFLINRNNQKLVDFQITQSTKKLNEAYNESLLEKFILNSLISDHKQKNNYRTDDLNITKTMASLDEFYFVKQFEFILQYFSQHYFGIALPLKDITSKYEGLKTKFYESQVKNNSICQLYIHATEMLIKEDSRASDKLLKLLNQYENKINNKHKVTMYTLVRNFCVKQYSLGHQEYLKKAFGCYKNDLKTRRIYDNGKISLSSVQAIVKLGLRSKEFKWVHSFLKEHEDQFNLEQNLFNLNWAEYYFAINQYEKCLTILDDNYDDIHYKVSSKRLVIKCYYEMQSPILDSKINAFKLFIYRLKQNQITHIHKKGNNNFIDFLKQIILPSTFKNAKRIESLGKKIRTTKAIADKDWLIQKLNGMK